MDSTSKLNQPALLNLGCGSRYRPEWVNVDLHPLAPGILAHDLLLPLPFSDGSFDLVYHSHVLEHMDRFEAGKFIKECFRVCKPGGIIRVVVPDLENIAELYLSSLEQAWDFEPGAEIRYQWMMLELYDQTVRNTSGGEMAGFLCDPAQKEKAFAVSRIGKTMFSHLQTRLNTKIDLWTRIRTLTLKAFWSRIRLLLTYGFISMMMGKKWRKEFDLVVLRCSGEIHKWMYDRYSLRALLSAAGFVGFKRWSADDSYFQGWQSFHLDTEPDGSVYKPDSLFCEAIKPHAPTPG